MGARIWSRGFGFFGGGVFRIQACIAGGGGVVARLLSVYLGRGVGGLQLVLRVRILSLGLGLLRVTRYGVYGGLVWNLCVGFGGWVFVYF